VVGGSVAGPSTGQVRSDHNTPHAEAFYTPLMASSDESNIGPEAIHAPWRMAYLESLSEAEKAPQTGAATGDSGSFLRDYWLAPDDDGPNHVIVRAGRGMILLNKYPYANGHLLVALGEARPTLLDYDPAQREHLWKLTELATDLMESTLVPQGVNIGINQGRAAGAGIPGHLHVHLVPRWSGDVNFISTVGRIRVIPSSLDAMADQYRSVWNARTRS
jgi:ATP adenylyltransferase